MNFSISIKKKNVILKFEQFINADYDTDTDTDTDYDNDYDYDWIGRNYRVTCQINK